MTTTTQSRRGRDPRTPVLIGVGQWSNRVDHGDSPVEPVDLMAEALSRAADDSGASSGLLASADSIRVMSLLSWRYRDPGALLASRLGAADATTAYTVMGGNYVQSIVNRTACDIIEGRNDLVLLAGAEAWRTNRAMKRAGRRPDWTKQDGDVRPDILYGADDPEMSHPAELAAGINAPMQIYPMMDNALAHHLGLSVAEQSRRISSLWARLSEVAAGNPNAWIQRSYTAEELATPTPDNRMIGWPYTKRLNSNNAVEQGAALIMTSAARAGDLGVPRERWIYIHAGADAHDHWYLSNRADLHSSPAMASAGAAALDLARTDIDGLAHIDLYSCFPAAVQIAAAELGLDINRDLTVTGGMSFAGGPWNNYVMHAIATMADRLRSDPGSLGLVTANGGYTTKHAFGVYSTSPPSAGRFRWVSPQAAVDALPGRDVAPAHTGPATLETYTVMHDRDGGPEAAPAALLTDDGRRAWATSTDPDTIGSLLSDRRIGAEVMVTDSGFVLT